MCVCVYDIYITPSLVSLEGSRRSKAHFEIVERTTIPYVRRPRNNGKASKTRCVLPRQLCRPLRILRHGHSTLLYLTPRQQQRHKNRENPLSVFVGGGETARISSCSHRAQISHTSKRPLIIYRSRGRLLRSEFRLLVSILDYSPPRAR